MESRIWPHRPEGARQEADAMRGLWNQLVDASERRQAAYRELAPRLPQAAGPRAGVETVRPALQQLQKSFFAETCLLTAECTATWANREFIHNQFLAATGRFFKRQSGPPRHKLGPPQEAHFQHRFTGGGVPVARIFGRSQRLHLASVPPAAFNPSLPQRQRKRLARTTLTFQASAPPHPRRTP